MQDKQHIIIDGVDVSGCIHYFNKGCLTSGLKALGVFCFNNPNCYFKQLQHKIAELLKLQNTISSELPAYEKCISMARDDVYAGILDRNASETDFCIHVIRETRNQLQYKTAECEELKKKFSKFFNIDNQECWDIAFLKDENARYKQALDEIEEYCRQNKHSGWVDIERILDIISNAKGWGDE